MSDPADELAPLLARARAGEAGAAGALFDLLYRELRALAGSYLRGDRGHGTLQPTAVVHEAFLRMLRSPGSYEDRGHFLAVAATAMRQVVVDHARRRRAHKRGGARTLLQLSDVELGAGGAAEAAGGAEGRLVDVLALDRALRALAERSAQQARVIELRYFGGLTVEEVAAVLGVSVGLIEKEWRRGRAWLGHALEGAGAGDGDGA